MEEVIYASQEKKGLAVSDCDFKIERNPISPSSAQEGFGGRGLGWVVDAFGQRQLDRFCPFPAVFRERLVQEGDGMQSNQPVGFRDHHNIVPLLASCPGWNSTCHFLLSASLGISSVVFNLFSPTPVALGL